MLVVEVVEQIIQELHKHVPLVVLAAEALVVYKLRQHQQLLEQKILVVEVVVELLVLQAHLAVPVSSSSLTHHKYLKNSNEYSEC
jgi:DTW domain-containing protein YfiP